MNIYQLEMTALCPNGKLADRYAVEIRSAATIQVEKILAATHRLAGIKMFQEDIADTLRNELQAGVTVTGWHFGVKVTCMRE